MKEFIYTCEHCGSEYTITEPGRYQCQNCNNAFTVEDQEQKQAERMEQIRKRAEAEEMAKAKTAKQPITADKLKAKARRKKFNLSNIGLTLLILYSLFQLLQLISMSKFQKADVMFKEAGEFYFSIIAICVYVLLQKIEQNTRKGE